MPAFSFTAPQVTPDMELAEREALPDHVWFGILNDMHGWETSPMCNQTVQKSKGQTELPPIPVGAIDQVLYEMSKLPLVQTREYRDAEAQVPQLVEAESAVEDFLRCEKFDYQVGRLSMIMHDPDRVKRVTSLKRLMILSLSLDNPRRQPNDWHTIGKFDISSSAPKRRFFQ